MGLRTRLEKLEQRVGPKGGCPACRVRRGQHRIVIVEELRDGTLLPAQGEPQPCARCGNVPEFVTTVVVPVVADLRENFGPDLRAGQH
jgi:hypothetical protein